jgi:hypothetical protein
LAGTEFPVEGWAEVAIADRSASTYSQIVSEHVLSRDVPLNTVAERVRALFRLVHDIAKTDP